MCVRSKNIQEIGIVYNIDINHQCIKVLYLFYKRAFANIKHLLTWYFLSKLYYLLLLVIFSLIYIFKKLFAKEWEATKQISDTIKTNKNKKKYFNINDYHSQYFF